MAKRLPARPNLEFLRAQAKTLLTKFRGGDVKAAQTLSAFAPGVDLAQVRLADAQGAVARKSGFAAWPSLARHVERLRSLEGTWAFRSLEIEGQALPSSVFSYSSLLIDGDRFRMESPEENYEGILTIDVEKTPHWINIDFNEGPEAGNTCEGLFELDGDGLTICLGLAGSTRPEQFTTSHGSGHALEHLVRREHIRPAGVDGGTLQPQPAPVAPASDPGDFDGPLTGVLEKLQGEWLALELISSGKPLAASYLPYGSRTQMGRQTKVVFGGQTMVHAKVRFNEAASPIEVDYLSLMKKGQGVISLGVFRWEGDEAVFCIAAPETPRPTGFVSTPGSGRTYSRWRLKP